MISLRTKPLPYKIYGKQEIEQKAIDQMDMAMRLPISIAGALMPDAHEGYGLPIGGVVATKNEVMPYGVGLDIGCRMCLTIYDLPVSLIKDKKDSLMQSLNHNTYFGVGSKSPGDKDHPILARKEFQEIKILKSLHSLAVAQIGTSGSGNHFVEIGIVELYESEKNVIIKNTKDEVPSGQYFAILSHSGSRGLGAKVANYYTKIAKQKCDLPKEAMNLAWLTLDSQEGQEYWLAMTLAGDYSSVNHELIHNRIHKELGGQRLAKIENFHNFAWKEKINNQELIVHRKGATPAGKGDLGIIPGSMISKAFIVQGKGDEESLNSVSHGAGRLMSRKQAKKSFTNKQLKQVLQEKGVDLIGAGLDEVPMAYKDINKVMEYQKDLVQILGTFQPKIVKMDR